MHRLGAGNVVGRRSKGKFQLKIMQNSLASTSRLRCRLIVAAAAMMLVHCGCTPDLTGIDDRADLVIADHIGRLGPAALAPAFEPVSAGQTLGDISGRSPAPTQYDPPTVDPPVSSLSFSLADPDRDINEILLRYTQLPDDVPQLDLYQTLEYAVGHAREYLTAKEELLLAALRLLTERHRFGPRFFNDVSSTFDFDAEDGDYAIAAVLINELRVTRQLRSGGQLSVRALVQATEQLRERVGDSTAQSASIILSADLPLLRGAGDIAQESLIGAERQMVYAARSFERFRRRFLFDIATDYFNLVQTARQIKNAERVQKSRDDLLAEAMALYQAGWEAKFEVSEAEQRVLAGENSLAAQRDVFILQLERFRIRLGLPPGDPFQIVPNVDFELPIPELDMADSVRRALMYRLDLQTTRDRVDDSRRAVSNARNSLLPDLNLTGSATVITARGPRRAGLQFDLEQTDFTAAITFGLPLDREIERLSLRQAIINLERAVRDLHEVEDQIALTVRSAIRDIQLALFSLEIQRKSIEVIEKRIEGLKLRREEVTTRQFIDAADELAAALDQLESARRDLRVAILRYLLETGQFRVDPRGSFLPPPGLEPIPLEPDDEPGEDANQAPER